MSSFSHSVPFAVAAACVYGTSIVVQHRSASDQSAGESSAGGLIRLLRDPVWVVAVLGDFVGFVLNAIALSIGKVVYVQPFVVLMLPVALLVQWFMGGSPPRRGDYLGCLAIFVGLAVFLTLVGSPPHQRVPHARWVAIAVAAVLVCGALLCVAAIRAGPRLRGAVYGGVAGAFFGTIAVMIDASSDIVGGHHGHRHHGFRGIREQVQGGLDGLFETQRGLVIVVAIALLGVGGIILTQLSFQIGALGATLPANMVLDPLFGVLLGAVLLREFIPVSPAHILAYVLCLALIAAGGIRLAQPAIGTAPGHPPVRGDSAADKPNGRPDAPHH
ncbi:MAG: DMT family transporter [Jatrophihabitans sp.]